MAYDLTWCDNVNGRQDNAAAHVDGVRNTIPQTGSYCQKRNQRVGSAVQNARHCYGLADAEDFIDGTALRTPCRNDKIRKLYVHITERQI